MTKYVIQFDSKRKYGILVMTFGLNKPMGYFCHMTDAKAWCEAN